MIIIPWPIEARVTETHRRFAGRWGALRGNGLTRSDIYCAIWKINLEKE